MKPARLSLALAVAIGLVAYAVLQWSPPPGRKLELTPAVAEVLNDAGSPAVGAATPDVTVVIFTDYQCPICKRADPALSRLIAIDPNVRVVWKDWPIRGPGSDLAARTALAAHAQGRYAEVHDALMAARGQLTPARIADIARQAGADPVRLAADLRTEARAIDAQLGRHRLQAFSLGLQGTPAYLVGPYLIQGGLDDRALSAAVRRARRAGPPK
ncbi:MAG: DsbA family protein [Alphaproteobacteria bacterium]|nr:DsbA family protein [Alphaproteobacteria bacterium]MBU1514298.1 DsbA family protein [Alphaproteobacteria bacterium]MBU2095942.1 DsbA family protein [Alphaproteobacteria bacterium]MBU2150987.1 DsbA family protein [Alphaproteobacteria bacterium]MBU2308497.1 DsbA family protein [Alphaproteobacteria bacterium]